MTREDKAKEEMEWRKINEDIELEREGVEPLLDSYFVYATEVLCPLCVQLIRFRLVKVNCQRRNACCGRSHRTKGIYRTTFV